MTDILDKQIDIVAGRLKNVGDSITSMEAMVDHGIMRLASVIHDMREDDFPVDTIMESDGKRRWARYTKHDGGRPDKVNRSITRYFQQRTWERYND